MSVAGEAPSPATRLLLAAAHPRRDRAALAAAAAAVADWDEALAGADRHGLLPQLAARLAAAGAAVPEAPADRLHRAALAAGARAARLLPELARLLELLAAGGADAVPWKGPVGSHQAHGDAAWRLPEDLDLLLRPAEARRALALLHADGFRPLAAASPRLELELLERRGSLTLEHPESGVRVDLATSFWQPAFPHPFTPEALIGRARPLAIDGRRLPALPPAATLLALAVHGSKHRWERLCWAADFAATAAALAEPAWAECLADARRLRVLRALRVGLAVADRLFPRCLPAAAAAALAGEPSAALLGRRAADAALASREAPAGQPGAADGLDDLGFVLRVLDRRRDRAALLWRASTVPNPNEEAWIRLPPALFALHRLLRPLRLAAVHGPRLLRRALRSTDFA